MTRLLRAREYIDAECFCGKTWRGSLGTDPTLQCDVCHPGKPLPPVVTLDESPTHEQSTALRINGVLAFQEESTMRLDVRLRYLCRWMQYAAHGPMEW